MSATVTVFGSSPLSSFLVIWSPSGDTRGPSFVFEAVDVPCPGPFHFSHIREAPWSSGKALALDAARPRSIPGLGGENY